MNKKDIRNKEKSVSKYLKYGFISFIVLIVVAAAVILYVNHTKSYVATVGSEKITTAEFNFFLKQVKSSILNEVDIQPDTPEADTFWNTAKFEGEDAEQYAKKKALESAKDLKVQVIKAKENNVRFEKDEEKNIEEYIEQNFISQEHSKSEVNEYMQIQYGINIDEFKDIYKQIMLTQKLASQQIKDVELSEDEMLAYYEKYPDLFTASMYRTEDEEAVWARHILVKTPGDLKEDATEEERQEYDRGVKEAKEKAEDILEKAKNGEDFSELAKEYSEDVGSAESGGDYVFMRGQMVTEFEEAAFDELQEGEISELVKTVHGFHILKLEEKIPQEAPVSFRCAKEYREFGTDAFKYATYKEKLDGWRSEYSVQLNNSVYNSIEVA